ncbi:pollen-specific leucine-rich repeat extensin-like protein 2 isoform X2 [Coregonus clupeaformis]|uniref:pollen-specific leucine-rich repeat extensin-like protein 2 isoform X2 n=1 Tax=Coregonus clupeaformis TaxID=59861 RepID=UPI001BDFF582|nr:pollen-specific leucine-rich repeat extensin-like protein 2 isoform X2 [Coregonus clupeaformis]
MGTVVQQCAATGLNKLLSRVEREWAKSSWTDGHVTSTRMMSQKKPLHPQMMTPNLDNTHIPTSSADKKQQRRQKHKPNIPSVKHNTNTSELSPQGQFDPPSLPFSLLSAVDGKERRERREQQQEAQVPGAATTAGMASDPDGSGGEWESVLCSNQSLLFPPRCTLPPRETQLAQVHPPVPESIPSYSPLVPVSPFLCPALWLPRSLPTLYWGLPLTHPKQPHLPSPPPPRLPLGPPGPRLPPQEELQ